MTPPAPSTPWTVRPAVPGDYPDILDINAEGVPGVSAFDRSRLERLAAAADPLLVAVSDGRVAAYLIAFTPDAAYDGACYLWFREHEQRFLYIDQVAVGARWRRQGAGSALYDAAAGAARERGLDRLTCEVNLEPPNPESMRFHEVRSFAPAGVLDVPDGRRVSLLVKTSLDSAGHAPR